MGSDDINRRGQILWIRGLTRLQHQVSTPLLSSSTLLSSAALSSAASSSATAEAKEVSVSFGLMWSLLISVFSLACDIILQETELLNLIELCHAKLISFTQLPSSCSLPLPFYLKVTLTFSWLSTFIWPWACPTHFNRPHYPLSQPHQEWYGLFIYTKTNFLRAEVWESCQTFPSCLLEAAEW